MKGGRRKGHKRANLSRLEILERDGWRCRYCGSDFSGLARPERLALLSVDHVLPVCRGGSDEPENMVAACLRCNGMKAERTVEEWRAGVPRRFCVGDPFSVVEILAWKRNGRARGAEDNHATA